MAGYKSEKNRQTVKELTVTGSLRVNGETVAGGVAVGESEVIDMNGEADALILDADGDTTISAPSDDQIDIELKSVDHIVLKAVAVADAGATTNIVEIAATTPVDTEGTNVHNMLNIDVEVGNSSGGTNAVRAIAIDAITGDAQVTATAIHIGSGWDVGVAVDVIGESTSAAGVTVDGVLLKDSTVTARNPVVAVTDDGAISVPNGNTTYFITKAGVAAMTLVDPTTGTHDGLRLTFISTTAQAHTLDLVTGINGGAADVGTFGGDVGDMVVIEAYQGDWYLVSATNVTFA